MLSGSFILSGGKKAQRLNIGSFLVAEGSQYLRAPSHHTLHSTPDTKVAHVWQQQEVQKWELLSGG